MGDFIISKHTFLTYNCLSNQSNNQINYQFIPIIYYIRLFQLHAYGLTHSYEKM